MQNTPLSLSPYIYSEVCSVGSTSQLVTCMEQESDDTKIWENVTTIAAVDSDTITANTEHLG